MKYAFVGVVLVALSACSTAQEAQEKGQFTRRSPYDIETIFGDSPIGKTYAFERTPPYDSEAYAYDWRLLKRYLALMGMKDADGTRLTPDLMISLSVKTEDPPTGISIGVILPYTHIVTVTAKKNGKVDWQVRAQGISEEKDHRKSLHRLWGASRHFLGQSSAGEQRIHLADNDEKMIELLEGQAVQAAGEVQ